MPSFFSRNWGNGGLLWVTCPPTLVFMLWKTDKIQYRAATNAAL